MSYIPTKPFIFKSIITFSFSLILVKQLYAPYKLALYVILIILNLIFDCFGFELAVAVYGGLFTRQPLPYIPCIP